MAQNIIPAVIYNRVKLTNDEPSKIGVGVVVDFARIDRDRPEIGKYVKEALQHGYPVQNEQKFIEKFDNEGSPVFPYPVFKVNYNYIFCIDTNEDWIEKNQDKEDYWKEIVKKAMIFAFESCLDSIYIPYEKLKWLVGERHVNEVLFTALKEFYFDQHKYYRFRGKCYIHFNGSDRTVIEKGKNQYFGVSDHVEDVHDNPTATSIKKDAFNHMHSTLRPHINTFLDEKDLFGKSLNNNNDFVSIEASIANCNGLLQLMNDISVRFIEHYDDDNN